MENNNRFAEFQKLYLRAIAPKWQKYEKIRYGKIQEFWLSSIFATVFL